MNDSELRTIHYVLGLLEESKEYYPTKKAYCALLNMVLNHDYEHGTSHYLTDPKIAMKITCTIDEWENNND